MLAGDLKLTTLHTRSSIQQIQSIGGSFTHERGFFDGYFAEKLAHIVFLELVS